MGGKIEQVKTSNMLTPGPGTYNARFPGNIQTSPQYKMGTSTRDDVDRVNKRACDFPPPDSYSPNYKTVKERGASWTLGRSGRANLA